MLGAENESADMAASEVHRAGGSGGALTAVPSQQWWVRPLKQTPSSDAVCWLRGLHHHRMLTEMCRPKFQEDQHNFADIEIQA